MPLRVLTWHIHGSYLRYLAACGHELVMPVKPSRSDGYAGAPTGGVVPDNFTEVPADEIAGVDLDVVLCQSHRNWEVDRFDILSREQQHELPRVVVEHDPPRQSPTDTRHPVDDPETLLVHVTHFNELMWDSGQTPTTVIDHGVPDTGARWTGELERGLVVVNGLHRRGRRLGTDVFQRMRERVPLDLVGMESKELGGLGEIPLGDLAQFSAQYRFFFNPIRYTSLGLAVCEAMMVGLPIIGLATTEMVTAVENGRSGWVETNEDALADHMLRLLDDHDEAARLSKGAREVAETRFSIDRFGRDWDRVLRSVSAGKDRQVLPIV